jgi:hypothetical protein
LKAEHNQLKPLKIFLGAEPVYLGIQGPEDPP